MSIARPYHPRREDYLRIIRLLVFSCLCVFASAGFLSLKFKIPAGEILAEIRESYYFPYVNSSTVGEVAGIHFHYLYFGLIIASVLVFCLGKWCFSPRPGRGEFRRAACGISFIFYFFLIGLQWSNHARVFRKEFELFAGQTLDEKLSFIHKAPYDFAMFCKGRVTGRYKGDLLTELDIDREPDMGEHRKLAYFLYPEIDIRGVTGRSPARYFVIYEKKDAVDHVPDGFQVIGVFSDSSLLAERRRP